MGVGGGVEVVEESRVGRLVGVPEGVGVTEGRTVPVREAVSVDLVVGEIVGVEVLVAADVEKPKGPKVELDPGWPSPNSGNAGASTCAPASQKDALPVVSNRDSIRNVTVPENSTVK